MFFTYGVREVSVRNCILFRDAVYVFTLHSFGKLLSLPDWYTSSPPRLTWTNLFPFCLSDPLRSVSHYVHHLTIWFRTICVSVCVKNPQECNKIHTYTHSWWLHLLNHTLCTWAIWFSEITDFTLFAVVFLLACWCMSIIYTNTYNMCTCVRVFMLLLCGFRLIMLGFWDATHHSWTHKRASTHRSCGLTWCRQMNTTETFCFGSD